MTHEEEQEFLMSEIEWICEIAGEPDRLERGFVCWITKDVRITAIVIRKRGHRHVDYGVLTDMNTSQSRFVRGAYSDYIRREVLSALVKQGNWLAAAELAELGPKEDAQ